MFFDGGDDFFGHFVCRNLLAGWWVELGRAPISPVECVMLVWSDLGEM